MPSNEETLNASSPPGSAPRPQSPSRHRSQQIGPYKTLEILGEGGMGVVYRAQQTKPVRREVALKLIKLGMDTKQVIARFESERQALALMDHSNIAKVFDAGASDQGRPYFVMEIVHGLPITEHCDRHKLSIDQRLDLFMETCEAIQHAHQKGIIHRDIKPSNILVEYRDGQATPKIIDFGVAKATSQRLTEKTLFTEQGQMIGTPAYMSPEQADLSTQDIDTRSDIYSLGVLLYELLTGTLPFDAKSLRSAGFGEIQRIIRDEEPQKPSTRMSSGGSASSALEDAADSGSLEAAAKKRGSDPRTLINKIRGDLDWIVMKCLEKDRARRYETANGLASDIRRHLSDEAVLASPPSAGYRLRKLIKRNRTGAFAIIVVAFALVSATIVSVGFALSEAEQRRIAVNAEKDQSRAREAADQARSAEEKQRKLAEQREQTLRATLCRNGVQQARQAYALQEIARMKAVLETACPPDLRGWEWYYEISNSDRSELTHMVGEPLYSLAFSPDGQLIAIGEAGNICIRTVQAGETIRAWRAHDGGVMSIRFSPDGEWIISHGRDGAKVWRVADGIRASRVSGRNWDIWDLDVAPDGDRIAAIMPPGRITMWDRQGRVVPGFRSPKTSASLLAFHPLGDTLAVLSFQGQISTLDVSTGEILHTSELPTTPRCLVYSPDGTRIILGDEDGNVIIYDNTTRAVSASVHAHNGRINHVAYSRDGRYFATAGVDKTIRLWNAATSKPIAVLIGHERPVTSVAFSPVTDLVASVSMDGSIKLWNTRDQIETCSLCGLYESQVHDLSVNFDGSKISVYCKNRGDRIVYDVVADRELWRISQKYGSTCALAEGDQLVCVGASTISIWSDAVGSELRTVNLPALRGSIHVSENGALALIQGFGTWMSGAVPIQIVDVPTSRIVAQLEESAGINGRFSPDGVLVAGRGGDRVYVWNPRTGRIINVFEGDGPFALGYGGRYLAVSNHGGVVDVWNVFDGDFISRFGAHEFEVMTLAISPDNSRVVSGDAQGTIVLWDIIGGHEVLRVKRHEDGIKGIKFSADGTRMFTIGEDGVVEIWRAPGLAKRPAEKYEKEDADDSL